MKYSLLQTLKISTCSSIFRHPVLCKNKRACSYLLIKTLVYPKPKPTLLGASLSVVNNLI